MYVGITRARADARGQHAKRRKKRAARRSPALPSRFIAEMKLDERQARRGSARPS